jgi:hypothetical protein
MNYLRSLILASLVSGIVGLVALTPPLPQGMRRASDPAPAPAASDPAVEPTNLRARADRNMLDACRFTAHADDIILNGDSSWLTENEARQARAFYDAAAIHRAAAIEQLIRK